jgi:DNA-binding NtrC family response regulator
VLQHTNGNRTAAARILGISRVGLLAKLKRLEIDADAVAQRGAPAAHAERPH